MSNESTKTRAIRPSDFEEKYLKGKVIDIGGGIDPVTTNSEVFDLEDGDAQHILQYREAASYDAVHSSHCLEHMKDVPAALKQWWDLVRTGGYMIIVVPHEDLYEQSMWPPIFNSDHKATFRINKQESWSSVSYDLYQLANELPNAEIIETVIHDQDYDYNIQGGKFNSTLRKIYKWNYSNSSIKKNIASTLYKLLYNKFYKHGNNNKGLPVDQTRWNALAQIQIIIKNTLHSSP
jgi:SAM-dependent methyltransferase